MQEYLKTRDDLKEKLSAQNTVLVDLLRNQKTVHSNVKELSKNLENLDSIINSLKDEKYRMMSAVFRNQINKNKPSDVMKMNFAQVLKNKSKIFKSGTFRNSLVFLEGMNDSVTKKENVKLSNNLEMLEDITEKDKTIIIIDEQSLIMNKIENSLIEQNIEKALTEYDLLLNIQKTTCSFDNYIKRKKYEKIIFDELKKILSNLKIEKKQPNFEKIEEVIQPMMKLEKYREVVKIILQYISRCLGHKDEKKKKQTLEEIVIEFMSIVSDSSNFINQKFNECFKNSEHFVIFGNWFIEEFKIFLHDIIEEFGESDKDELAKEIGLFCLDYEVKGLGVDFIIKKIFNQTKTKN